MKKIQLGLAAMMLLVGWTGIGFAQSEPFSLTEAPFGSPTIDGDISDWMAMRNDKNVLNFSFTHGQRADAAVGEPLEVNIQYAWDETNFYFLAEEVSDDDPSSFITDLDWCQECEGGSGDAAPWSTDSVGFYDQGITWPADGNPSADLDPLSTAMQEKGPFTQFWVGLPVAEDMVIDDSKQNFHLTRVLNPGGGEGGARLIGERSVNENFTQMIPDLPELTTVQSAHGIVEDGSNGGRGRRFTEAFMRWDQIRYPDPEKNDLGDPEDPEANPMAARIDALNNPESLDLELDQLKGHYVEDVKEGYEFRLDPLLVDGLSGDDQPPFPFGGQTHPSGTEHPNVSQAMDWSDISVVRLVAGSVSLQGDCDSSGALDAGDLSCVTTVADRDAVLGALNTIPGDLDGIDGVVFADFLTLSGNFGNESGSYADGNINLQDGIDFADFLVLSGNFGKTAAGAASSVPEPTGIALFSLGALFLGRMRRRRCLT